MAIAICEHIKDNGATCGSPALTGYSFCFFHQRLRQPRHRPGDFEYKLPILDTPESILMATQHITQAALDGVLEERRARLVLSALRLAMTALKAMNAAGEQSPLPSKSLENNVDTGFQARVTRAQLAVSPATEPAPEPIQSTTASTLSSRAPVVGGEGSAFAPVATYPPTPTKKLPLSATQLKLMKKILRRGPSDPRFATAARLLDSQISHARTT
jgi:hypothetical protein